MCMGSLEQSGELPAARVWMHVVVVSILLFLAQPLTPHETSDHLPLQWGQQWLADGAE